MGSPESLPQPSLSLEAVVTDICDAGRVTVQSLEEGSLRDVRVAVVGYQATIGDRVILARTSSSTFIIGVVASSLKVSIAVEDGSVVLRGTDGEVVIRHDPEAKETRLGAAAGDLLLEAPQGTMRLHAKALVLEADTISQRAREVITVATHIQWSADRWDVRAHRIKERAASVLRTVDGALTTRAGRVRTVVRGAAQLLAKRTTIRSKEDTAIDGRQVLLG